MTIHPGRFHLSLLAETHVRKAVVELDTYGYIRESAGIVTLTKKGTEYHTGGHADSELAKDRFLASLRDRAERSSQREADPARIAAIASVAAAFLEEACRKRGLGVALQLTSGDETKNATRSAALLASIHDHIEKLSSREEAIAAVQLVRGVLGSPAEHERAYLGFLTQAYFATHLLGRDTAALEVQRRAIGKTVFIADASVLIPLLATGSPEHQPIIRTFRLLQEIGSQVVTTDLLLRETTEHAGWGWNRLQEYGKASFEILCAAQGIRGYKQNLFLKGYLSHPDFGPTTSFVSYFDAVFGASGERPDDALVEAALRRLSVTVLELHEWNGFTDDLWVERDNIEAEVSRRRQEARTYTRPDQVRAEAEVVLLVTAVRRGRLSPKASEEPSPEGAFFLSHSRVVDGIEGYARKIVMPPEGLLELLLSVREVTEEDAGAVFEQVLCDLVESGEQVVTRDDLTRAFHGIVEVSETRLIEAMAEYRQSVVDTYARDPRSLVQGMSPLDRILAVEPATELAMASMRSRLAEEERLRFEAQAAVKKVEKQLAELAHLKAREAERKAKVAKKSRKKR